MPWTRDEIVEAAFAAEREYLQHNQSARICTMVVVDTVARLVIDNAATLAEIHAPDIPEVADKITSMKDEFQLGS